MTPPADPAPPPAAPATGSAPVSRPLRWLFARGGRPLALAVLLAGLAATAFLARRVALAETARRQAAFRAEAESLFSRAMDEIQTFMEILDSIRQLYTLEIPPEQAADLTAKTMLYQRRVLGTYAFAQLIPHATRETMDYDARVAPIRIDDPASPGDYVPSPAKPFYFPVTSQVPADGLGLPDGYDLSSRPDDAKALRGMDRTGVFALGGPAPAIPGSRLLYAPIRYPNGVLLGAAIAPFRPDRILAAARDALGRPPLEAALASTRGAPPPLEAPFAFVRLFVLADEQWCFSAVPAPGAPAAAPSRAAAKTAAAGTAVSLAVALLLLAFATRTRRIERLVALRTAELARANRRLAALNDERRELENDLLAAAVRERTRIGRDLHDSLGQKLTGALYLFSAFRKTAPDAPEAGLVAATLKDAVAQIRRIARGLAPIELTEDGLPDALRSLAEESTALFGLPVTFQPGSAPRLSGAAMAENLYLVAQEAVTNAARHARPTRILVSLSATPEGGLLAIDDDGPGLPSAPPPPGAPAPSPAEGGNGLRIMRHRAELLGGTLDLGPSPLGGLRVACRFPSPKA